MSEIKRVWSDKKTTWNDKEQVWLKDGELKKYDGEWRDVEGSIQVYEGSSFETLPGTAELDTYDSNTPEFIGTVEDGIEAAYVFKDWDGTVLASGKVKDGETPTAPENPTREGYEFTGWNPAVGPITKSTEYVAQYEQVIVNYTVTIVPNDDTLGTVDVSEVVAPEGTEITSSGNELYIGGTTVTATAEEGCEFVSWETDQSAFPLAEDCTYTAIFQVTPAPTIFLDKANAIVDESTGDTTTILFAETEEAQNRVEIHIVVDPLTSVQSVEAAGYGLFDPQGVSEAAALINALQSPTSVAVATTITGWASWTGEIGTIDSGFIAVLNTAWAESIQANWDAVVDYINDAAAVPESLITSDAILPESVGQASPDEVTIEEGQSTTVRFNYLPTDATIGAVYNMVFVASDDENVASAMLTGVSGDGECTLQITGESAGTATISYDVGGSPVYTVSVTVTAAAE